MNERWVARDSIARLSLLLGFVDDPLVQDWELQYADPNRIREFLNIYEQSSLNVDDRFALMSLIVASFDEWVSSGRTDESISKQISQLLTTNFSLHEATIHYWCLSDESDLNNVFSITPFMRAIWKQCSKVSKQGD